MIYVLDDFILFFHMCKASFTSVFSISEQQNKSIVIHERNKKWIKCRIGVVFKIESNK